MTERELRLLDERLIRLEDRSLMLSLAYIVIGVVLILLMLFA